MTVRIRLRVAVIVGEVGRDLGFVGVVVEFDCPKLVLVGLLRKILRVRVQHLERIATVPADLVLHQRLDALVHGLGSLLHTSKSRVILGRR